MCNFGESLGVSMKFSLNTNGSLCFAPAPTWVNLFSFPIFQYFLQRNECISVWYIGFIFIYLPWFHLLFSVRPLHDTAHATVEKSNSNKSKQTVHFHYPIFCLFSHLSIKQTFICRPPKKSCRFSFIPAIFNCFFFHALSRTKTRVLFSHQVKKNPIAPFCLLVVEVQGGFWMSHFPDVGSLHYVTLIFSFLGIWRRRSRTSLCLKNEEMSCRNYWNLNIVTLYLGGFQVFLVCNFGFWCSQMERIYGFQLMLVVCWGIFVGFTWCQDNADAVTAVYIVTLRQAPASHYYGDELRVNAEDFDHGASGGTTRLDTPRYYFPWF